MSCSSPVTSPGVTERGHQSRVARPRVSTGARDIFPLPIPLAEAPLHGRQLSRRSAQRVARKGHVDQRTQDAVLSLNWLAGFGFTENSGIYAPDPLQRNVLDRVHFLANLCNSKGELDQVPKPEAALMALLQGRSEYGSELPTTLAVCDLERISLPHTLQGAPEAVSLLDEKARRYLQDPEQMLRPVQEVSEEFVPYWDPQLRSHQRTYKKFIQKLHAANYLVYTQNPKNFCGVFFVKKPDGQKIRMIIDAREPTSCSRSHLGFSY